ncbi:MAG: DNA polymerase III subunit gamma/tau [Chloroflexi bacterium]|nr:MAG: DNA polymerase III subunit gamma/tau [Chloroflexota bacterium]
MTTALYRKYRSGTFAELVGQDHVAVTLRNEVAQGTVAHAYLFAGIRGTGKTSAARILARAVNCLDLQGGEPCNVCASCVEILGGGAVDVLEIDAASNRGIDEMRDLREKVKFLPALLRRKVYIIDEAHMLTTEAWNAFLKTLEEPPPHVLFVLATTEPHKVPETVRSRVQRFDFRRVGRADIAAHLASVAGTEQVAVDAEALDLIARASQGSVRDALSLLDQALATGERPLGLAAVRRGLGLADPATVRSLMTALAAADAAAALRAAATAFEAGADARQLLREMSRLARAAELVAVGYPEGADVGADDLETCRSLASEAPAGFWVQALDRFSEAEINLRQPVDARLQVELCLLRLTRGGGPDATPALLARVAALEDAAGGGAARPSATARRTEPVAAPVAPVVEPATAPVAAPVASTETVVASATAPVTEPAATPETDAAPLDHAPAAQQPSEPAPATTDATAAATGAAGAPSDVTAWQALWPQVVDAVSRRDAMLAGVLRSCKVVDGGPGRLVVGAPFGFHLERLQEKVKARLLADVVATLAGSPCTVEAVFCGEEPQREVSGDGGSTEADATQAALSAFPGSRIVGSRLRDTALE